MALTASDISAIAARFGNKIIKEQVNNEAPLMNGELLDKKDVEGQVAVVNIKSNFENAGYVADQGTLFNGSGSAPANGTQLPAYLFLRADIGRGAASLGTGKKDGVNIVLETIESAAGAMARTGDRALIKPGYTLTSGDVTVLNAGTPAAGDTDTLTGVTDISLFRINSVLELYDDSAAAVVEYLKVTAITYDPDVASFSVSLTRGISTVTGTAAGMGVTVTTSDVLYPLGAASNAPVSLSDLAATSGTVHGHSAAGEWIGNSYAMGGALTVAAMRNLHTQMLYRTGKKADVCLVHPVTLQRYEDLGVSGRRFTASDSIENGADRSPMFDGVPLKQDANCPMDEMYFFQKDCVKHGMWKDIADDADGSAKKPSDAGHAIVSQSNFSYDYQRWGAHNLLCNRRAGVAKITGITG